MKKTAPKLMRNNLVLGCMLVMGVCTVSAVHATDSQGGSSNVITVLTQLSTCTPTIHGLVCTNPPQ